VAPPVRRYRLPSDNVLAVVCQAAVFLTLLLALYLQMHLLHLRTKVDDANFRLRGAALDDKLDDIDAYAAEHGRSLATMLILLFSLPCALGVTLALYEAPQACRRARETFAASAASFRNLFDASYRRSARSVRSGRSGRFGRSEGSRGSGCGSRGGCTPSGLDLEASPSPMEPSAALEGGGLVARPAGRPAADAATALGGARLKPALKSSKQLSQRDARTSEAQPREMTAESGASEAGAVEGSAPLACPPAESTAAETTAAAAANALSPSKGQEALEAQGKGGRVSFAPS
jgi:hypothetical protein